MKFVLEYRYNILWRCEHMAYTINESCMKCGACADTCPLGIITEGEERYVIDADQCVSCGSCADACPLGAITEG